MAGLAHLGMGFTGRSLDSRIGLGWYLLAGMWPDAVYAVVMLLPVDQEAAGVYHHSLAACVIWALLVGGFVRLVTRDTRSALLMAAAVFSHWVLDAVTWPMAAVMDNPTRMPLWFAAEPSMGLGLYRTMASVVIGEAVLLGGGLFFYIRRKRREKSLRPAGAA